MIPFDSTLGRFVKTSEKIEEGYTVTEIQWLTPTFALSLIERDRNGSKGYSFGYEWITKSEYFETNQAYDEDGDYWQPVAGQEFLDLLTKAETECPKIDFTSPPKSPLTTLTEMDLLVASDMLQCSVEAINVMGEVASGNRGFDESGNIIQDFNLDLFNRLGPNHLNLYFCNVPLAFNIAYQIDPHMALMATTWGRYQLSGRHYLQAGFTSVDTFVEAMKVNEQNQLNALVEFIRRSGFFFRTDWTRDQTKAFVKHYLGGSVLTWI